MEILNDELEKEKKRLEILNDELEKEKKRLEILFNLRSGENKPSKDPTGYLGPILNTNEYIDYSETDISLKKYGIPEFRELKTSTRTVMVYSNIFFHLQEIFENLYITPVEVPLTKKKKNVDKKRLKAPYGAIISVQRGIHFRGIDLRKSRKHWCAATCQLMERRGNKDIKIKTVVEKPFLIKGTDIYEIKYFCTNCETYYSIKQLKKITNFLNQVSIVISIGKLILHIMMFKNNFKIAGCKEDDNAVEATMILWQDYITKISEGWRLKDSIDTTHPSGSAEIKEDPKFVFKLVMRNVDFRLGFFIDRASLNKFMNSPKYANYVSMSLCETTGTTNVNIKMYTNKPKGYTYNCLVMPCDRKPYFINILHNPYKPKKPKKDKFTTFIVFSSSEIILSGRYEENMREMYEFFVKECIKHREDIEEKVVKPKTDLLTHLENNGGLKLKSRSQRRQE